MSELKDFYPTPPALIAKMLDGTSLSSINTLLEPSAGKGDICDYITETYRYSGTIEIDTIEINPELQHILKGKEYNVIFDNFLTFKSEKAYDLIIANFPFSDGVQHAVHAITYLENLGGRLVFLVNAETIRNPFTNYRKLLVDKLEKYGASVEYLTEEFVEAERTTSVEVALVKMEIEKREYDSFILDQLQKSEIQEVAELDADESLIEKNFINALIARFNKECKAGVHFIEEYYKLTPFIMSTLPKKDAQGSTTSPIIELKLNNKSARGRKDAVNVYLKSIRYKYWEVLVNDPRYIGQYTSNIVRDLQTKLTDLRSYDFNLFNIESLGKDMEKRLTEGVEKSILDLFDKFSVTYAWDDSIHQKNTHYYNGWKTNKSWKINNKVIVPMNGIFSSYSSKQKFDYNMRDIFSDMVKVFNYLSDDKTEAKQLATSAMDAADHETNFTNVDFKYFTATFYKKGSCHIKFTDKLLLDKFNIFGSQRKGWLPPFYGKKGYDDMDSEEKAVIEGFQGKEEYAKVVNDPQKYIVDDVLMLVGSND